MDFHELHEKKSNEMKEKFADVINDLSVKYGVDVGVAWNYFENIVRGKLEKFEAEQTTEIEFDMVEAIRDYAELKYYSNNCL